MIENILDDSGKIYNNVNIDDETRKEVEELTDLWSRFVQDTIRNGMHEDDLLHRLLSTWQGMYWRLLVRYVKERQIGKDSSHLNNSNDQNTKSGELNA
jgi:hypothetical protein